MTPIDIHDRAFDAPTLTKLDIFEKYAESWLPVFITTRFCPEVNMCDFFAGSGKDAIGQPGSPLRLIDSIERFLPLLERNPTKINLLLNEYDSAKFTSLKDCVNQKLSTVPKLAPFINIELTNQDFGELFPSSIIRLQKSCNLIFIDQNGIKQVTKDVFLKLAALDKTDFMFFISSSYLKRFGNEFENVFPHEMLQKMATCENSLCHRIVLDYYRALLPPDIPTRLFPFSIKRDQNVYGLVFGARHPLAFDKFLKVAWDKNSLNGEANFDIDDASQVRQTNLFGIRRFTKRESFSNNLRDFVISKKSLSNKDVLDFAYENGHLPKHASDELRKMKKEKLISTGHLRINYKACYKDKQIESFRINKGMQNGNK